jgi:hypothetical protein
MKEESDLVRALFMTAEDVLAQLILGRAFRATMRTLERHPIEMIRADVNLQGLRSTSDGDTSISSIPVLINVHSQHWRVCVSGGKGAVVDVASPSEDAPGGNTPCSQGWNRKSLSKSRRNARSRLGR